MEARQNIFTGLNFQNSYANERTTKRNRSINIWFAPCARSHQSGKGSRETIYSNRFEERIVRTTHVVIENTGARSLHELLLVIKNTEANRLITLSGSDDNKQWYVIKENIYLSNLFTTPDERLIQSISFPNSNYKYFKITIIGKDILPVNIIRAGVYEAIVGPVQYRLLPSPVLTQKDSSDKCSYVLLQFDDAYMMNRIEIHTAGATFYKRKIEVSPEKNTYHIPSENFSISSDAQPVFALEDKTSRLLLKIYNNDNPPLQITGVNVFQRNICLLTFLEKDKSYHLLFDDSLARPPSYDLSFFKDSIHGNIDSINYEKAASNQSAINKEPVAGTSNRWWIWLAVAGACFVLLLLTIRLTKEINKRNA